MDKPIDNFEHILHLFLVFILLTLNRQMLIGKIPFKGYFEKNYKMQ